MQLTKQQAAALAATRVTLGMLLVWWGMHRVMNPDAMVGMQSKYYFGLFPSASLQYVWGYIQMVVGAAVVVGFMRKVFVPAQLLICGFSSMTILPALLDPLAVWLPFEKLSGSQLLFYPSAVMMAAGIFLWTMRAYDRYSVDAMMAARQDQGGAASVSPAE